MTMGTEIQKAVALRQNVQAAAHNLGKADSYLTYVKRAIPEAVPLAKRGVRMRRARYVRALTMWRREYIGTPVPTMKTVKESAHG